MKKFEFTLRALLSVKISLEKQYMSELGLCEQRIQAFQRELKNMRFRLGHLRADYSNSCRRGLKISDLTMYSVWFKAMRDNIIKQKEKIQLAEDDKKRIQNKIIEVMNERKMLEKLKEKQWEEYLRLLKAEDAAAIDEFLSNKIGSSVLSDPAARQVKTDIEQSVGVI